MRMDWNVMIPPRIPSSLFGKIQIRLYSLNTTDERYRYRKSGKDQNMQHHTDKSPPPPNLDAKRKAIVLKTRSKLERDAWCWAINMEIDRLAESQSRREEVARNAGGVAQIRS